MRMMSSPKSRRPSVETQEAGGGRREAEGKKQVDEVDSMWNKVWLEAGRFSIALE